MPSLLHTSGRARAALDVVYIAWAVSELLIRSTRPAHTGQAHNGNTRLAIVLGIAAGFGGGLAIAGGNAGPWMARHNWPLFDLGIALALAGILLRLWAVRTLGRFFQLDLVVQDHHTVVRSGPYRVIRHPAYAGPILFFIGIGLALDNWVSLALCAVLPTAAFVYRITTEERLLVAGLGDAYEQYRRATWRLLPGVW